MSWDLLVDVRPPHEGLSTHLARGESRRSSPTVWQQWSKNTTAQAWYLNYGSLKQKVHNRFIYMMGYYVI